MTTKTFSHIKEINLYHENEKIRFYRLEDSWFNPVKGKFITESELDYFIENYKDNGYIVVPVSKDENLTNAFDEIEHVVDFGLSLDELITQAKNIEIVNGDDLEEHAVLVNIQSKWNLLFKKSIVNNKLKIERDSVKDILNNFVIKGYKCKFYDKDWNTL